MHAAQDSNVFLLQQSFVRTAKGHPISVCLDTTLFRSARTHARLSGCASLLVRMRRSAAAFVNHDDESNAQIEPVVCRCVHS